MWARCCSETGYLFEYDIYLGKSVETSDSVSEKVVIKLTSCLSGTNCRLFFDNFYTSPSLLSKLFESNLYAIGTIRTDRKFFPMALLKHPKTLAQGESIVAFYENYKMMAIRWKDKRDVFFLSTIDITEDSTVVKRTNKVGRKIDVNCPNAVKSYQTYMGGVDKHDLLVSYYIHDRKAYKYWHRIFFRIIEDMVVNSFICYSKEIQGSLFDFKSSVATALINSYCDQSRTKLVGSNNQSKRNVAFRNKLSNAAIVRQSNHGLHQMESLGKRMRCEFCRILKKKENRTSWKCKHCNVPFCILTKRNCFKSYHEA